MAMSCSSAVAAFGCISASPIHRSKLTPTRIWTKNSWKVRVAAADVAEGGESSTPSASAAAAASAADQLTMMLRAEGSMPETSIPAVKSSLQEMEDVKDVTITAYEGLTTISLVKTTVIQATNVASEIVEAMEKGGFRMHTLNLAIDDED